MAKYTSSAVDSLSSRQSLSNMPYSNCTTRIIELKCLNLPEQATDAQYRELYRTYIQTAQRDNIINAHNLCDAIESIKYGIAPPVAFPTETVYGLGADATNESAVAGIFAAKGRPSDNPLIVHVSSTQHLEEVIDQPLPEIYVPVVRKFWPGPLTILLPVPKNSQFARNVYPGQNTIGFRMPSSKYARFFIAATGKPIAGPSANSSGKPSPTTASHVLDDLRGKINFILDGGPCDVGVESTVVDGLHDPPLILRPGGVSREELKGLGGKWANTGIGYDTQHHEHDDDFANSLLPKKEHENQNGFIVEMNGAPRAPGMKYKHYSPTARLILFTPTARRNSRVAEKLDSLSKSPGKTGKVRIVILDRTWGSFGGLDVDVAAAQNPSTDLAPRNSVDIGAKAKAWQSYLEHTGVVQTPSATLVSVPIYPQATSVHSSQTSPPSKPVPPSAASAASNSITFLARELFAILRFCDVLECDYIFAETVDRNMDSTAESTGKGNIDLGGDAMNYNRGGDREGERKREREKEKGGESVLDAVADRLRRAASEIVES